MKGEEFKMKGQILCYFNRDVREIRKKWAIDITTGLRRRGTWKDALALQRGALLMPWRTNLAIYWEVRQATFRKTNLGIIMTRNWQRVEMQDWQYSERLWHHDKNSDIIIKNPNNWKTRPSILFKRKLTTKKPKTVISTRARTVISLKSESVSPEKGDWWLERETGVCRASETDSVMRDEIDNSIITTRSSTFTEFLHDDEMLWNYRRDFVEQHVLLKEKA